jgi:hypothetical protein
MYSKKLLSLNMFSICQLTLADFYQLFLQKTNIIERLWCNIIEADYSALTPSTTSSAFHWHINEKLAFKLCPFFTSGHRYRKGKVMEPHLNKHDHIAAAIIAMPIAAIYAAIGLVKQYGSPAAVSKPAKQTQEPAQVTSVAIAANSSFVISDRTHSQCFGALKVCFYQYSKLKKIRIVGLKNGVRKEINFTQELALKIGVPYTMDSAINWVREVGFKSEIALPIIGPAISDQASTAVAIQNTEVFVSTKSNGIVASPKGKPFKGTILSMGEITRPGIDGKPPYQIFALKLRAQYGGVEKEFAGEHLSELSEKLSLQKGMSIQVQLLGRYPFDVIQNGVTESRTRNEFSVVVL